jgi:hypothetical protein
MAITERRFPARRSVRVIGEGTRRNPASVTDGVSFYGSSFCSRGDPGGRTSGGKAGPPPIQRAIIALRSCLINTLPAEQFGMGLGCQVSPAADLSQAPVAVKRERVMPPLFFTCPDTKQRVPTGIETDPKSLRAFWSKTLTVNCQSCGKVHELTVRKTYAEGILEDAVAAFRRA